MERYLVADNICAWPNLTLLADGTIVAVVFNQPSHGLVEGDTECWASEDGGHFWHRRGQVTRHEPGTVRMNVAAGLTGEGDLVVLCSGHGGPGFRGFVTGIWVCRSSDAGRTWRLDGRAEIPADLGACIPFGDMFPLEGRLAATVYTSHQPYAAQREFGSWLIFSADDGRTWGHPEAIAAGFNEPTGLHTGDGRVLVVARSWRDLAAGSKNGSFGGRAVEERLELFERSHGAADFSPLGPVTWPGHINGHLLSLRDGTILLSHGLRTPTYYGMGARLSEDGGYTWGAPILLARYDGATDGGYPSSVQAEDGAIVTAYYANRSAEHHRYHMGVVRWRPEEFTGG